MEFSDNNGVVLQACRDLQSVGLITEVSPEPGEEQQDVQSESNQETPEPRRCPQSLALVEFRIQQLQNRRFLLMKMQNFTKKTEQNISSEISEDSEEMCELDAVQKELEELLVKKEELEKQEGSSNQAEDGGYQECETPRGGVYMLPPLRVYREGQTEEPASCPITPVENLGDLGALTQCPSCGEVIVTETEREVGEAVWIACCLCSMIGCVAGCCLIPFFLKRLKNVRHQCPKCQAHIHTFQPF